MIITALGSSELAQAEAASGRDTQFTDVTGSHWAAGYVTAASSNAIVNGMGDGTFAPDANITYAQAMKMLVCAAGYEQWSVDKGGWPDGYMYYGNQLKIGNGVKDVTDSTEITRAQVAQMIDNVLTAPVCVDTKEYTYDAYGNKYAKLVAKDGYGDEYESILTKNHDAYKVKGIVTNNNKSSQGSVKSDEVEFTIQNARRWLDEEDQISKTKKNSISGLTFNVGDTDLADYLKQYVEVLVQETDDDEYVALSVTLAGQSDEVTLAADDYDEVKNGKIYFYSNGKTTSYKLDDAVELYVNGVKYDDAEAGIELFVKDNTSSDVTLIDTPSDDNNSTDGYYDLILVDYYGTAIVDDVDVDDDDVTLSFKNDNLGTEFGVDDDDQGATAILSWDFDLDDDSVTYTFTKDGQEVTAADLTEYDVLSIKYDVTADDFESSTFYDVVASTATEEGKYSLYNSEDGEYTVNGTVYEIVNTVSPSDIESGVTYTFYVDAFGSIAYVDEVSSAKKIAILDNAYTDNSGDDKVKLVFADGTTDTVIAKDTTLTVSGKNVANIDYAKQIVFVNGTSGDKNDVQNRVVEYTLNSSNELTIKELLTPYQQDTDGEYKEVSSKIGKVKFNDATSFISYNSGDKEYSSMDPSTLVDGDTYKAYGFSKMGSDSISRFVIVVDAEGNITATTSVAVYNKSLSTENDEGDTVYAYDLFINGENVIINGEDDDDLAANYAQGTAVMYKTNASGEITGFYALTDLDFSGTDGTAITDNVWNAFLTDSDSLIATQKEYIAGLKTSKYTPELFIGAVVGKSSKTFDIVNIKSSASDENDFENISFTDDTNFYLVDFNNKSAERISVSNASALVKATYSENDGAITWSKCPRFALVKTVDNDATDVVIYVPKKDNNVF
jgi:hypothetical protein